MNVKKIVAESAVKYIQDGMVVGLGSGTTAHWFIKKLGQMVEDGLEIKAVATSVESEVLAKELEIPIVNFEEIDQIDVTVDGADEVDPGLNLIKGGGGALLREKIVANACQQLIIIVDETKKVKHLGTFPLPVEVVPFALSLTKKKVEELGCKSEIRMSDENHRYRTDNGNFILDCEFGNISHPQELHQQLNMIPGVVDNGLFINLAPRVLVGYKNGNIETLKKSE
ncbi:ribose-5-phosphate isomerase RpiA [Marinilabilia rubra]|uniref:Ribose-5-phosphate isomerase A n=1 Tax=Marinilabilia rubra TaxID=2162893 RepID=A0A2U2B9F5_9BACT|nr:ribose-5-phosphate isomerase RpiA [Marinilabilia rubra]PWD99700.1 ribose 5-phosphate isomerase A [Marinilabilia rubra]